MWSGHHIAGNEISTFMYFEIWGFKVQAHVSSHTKYSLRRELTRLGEMGVRRNVAQSLI
jgi:hypothetical protein